MNAQVNALVGTSQSFTRVSLDAKQRILAFLLLRKSSSTVDAAWVQNVASWFQGWNNEQQLNAWCYALAAQTGFTTNGPDLQSIVDNGYPNVGGTVFAGWGGPNGVVDADVVKQLVNYGLLIDASANLTVRSSIS